MKTIPLSDSSEEEPMREVDGGGGEKSIKRKKTRRELRRVLEKDLHLESSEAAAPSESQKPEATLLVESVSLKKDMKRLRRLLEENGESVKKIRLDDDDEDSTDRSKVSPDSDSEREPKKRRSARLADKRSKEPEEKKVANEDLPFHCPICHKGFHLEAAMKRHRSGRCGRRYTVTPSYVRHFACPYKGDTGIKTKSGCRRVDTEDSASKAQKQEGEKKAKTIEKSKNVAPQVTVIDLTGRDSDEESRGEVAVDGGGEKAKTNDKPKKVAPEMIDLTGADSDDEPKGEMAGGGGEKIGIAGGETTYEESTGDE